MVGDVFFLRGSGAGWKMNMVTNYEYHGFCETSLRNIMD